MDIKKHLKESDLVTELAGAKDIRSARAILIAVEGIRDEKRTINETNPKRNNEDLTQDWVFIAGQISAFNMVLSLPKEAKKLINALPESQTP